MPLKVLYAGLRKENYDSARGFSFEYSNFYLTLAHMPGIEVIEHPFDRILEVGKKKFNDELLELARTRKPDILFAFMYTDEFDPAVLDEIKRTISTKTAAWFADDYWRFWNYSKHWAAHFDWVVTTYSKAVEWYRAAGFTNVIRSQWACNTAVYKPLEIEKDIDVSFVGQWKPRRARAIDALRKTGVRVEALGFGWPNGKISREKMLEIFSRSKICINLAERPSRFSLRVLARLFLKKSINRLTPDFHFSDNFRAWWHFAVPHTHARPFELAGCRAFVLCGRSEDIRAYYAEDVEMAFYDSTGDLVEKTKYYLAHADECERIAEAAYARTQRDHTYVARFEEIFKEIGKAL